MPVNSCLLWSPITQKPEVFFSPVPKSRRFLARSCQIHLQTQTVKTLGHHTTPKPCAICGLHFRQNNSRFFSHLSAALSSILYRRSFAKKHAFKIYGLRLVFERLVLPRLGKCILMSATLIWIVGFACLIFGIHTILRLLFPENNDIYW
jgi:hypothetical protein